MVRTRLSSTLFDRAVTHCAVVDRAVKHAVVESLRSLDHLTGPTMQGNYARGETR